MQFDVFANPDRTARSRLPYFVVLQHDVHDHLRTVVVAPVYHWAEFRPISTLTPVVEIEGERLSIAIPELSLVPRSFVGPAIANAEHRRDRIIAALDLLFTGV